MGKNRQGVKPRKNYTVRLSEQEQKTLLKKAGECGMKPSQYIRKLITEGGMVDMSLPEQRRDFINQIARIGNNINQIAHRANADRWISEYSVKSVEDHLKEIQKLMKEVLAKWR